MKLFCVTNRLLVCDDFLARIEQICSAHPSGIILREKDLSPQAYLNLSKSVLDICRKFNVPFIAHSQIDTVHMLGVNHIQLSYQSFINRQESNLFCGVSVHSEKEAVFACEHGANSLIAGHIFQTDCKKTLAPRGVGFLKKVCDAVSIPVYAIGGIHIDVLPDIKNSGASGICLMSELMTCKNPKETVLDYKSQLL